VLVGYEKARVVVLNSNYLKLKEIDLLPFLSSVSSVLDPKLVSLASSDNTQGFTALLRSGELLELATE